MTAHYHDIPVQSCTGDDICHDAEFQEDPMSQMWWQTVKYVTVINKSENKLKQQHYYRETTAQCDEMSGLNKISLLLPYAVICC
jgi:hypothetical protein